jgi:hypothetical protein
VGTFVGGCWEIVRGVARRASVCVPLPFGRGAVVGRTFGVVNRAGGVDRAGIGSGRPRFDWDLLALSEELRVGEAL